MVSEFSLHILTKASELAISQNLPISCAHSLSCLKKHDIINKIILQVKNSCKNDSISCEILSIGNQS
jgi:hypothetical protein